MNFGDPGKPQTSIFDLTVKAWTPLPLGIISPVWSPSDYRIAYLKENADGSESLMMLDVSKSTNKPVTLLTINMEDLSLMWPNKTQIVLHDKPSTDVQGSAWIFDLQKKTLIQPVPSGYSLETIWSSTTSSAGLVLSNATYGLSGGTLSFNPAGGAQAENLSFLTLPSKCVFNYNAASSGASSTSPAASSTAPAMGYLALYCGVPQDQGKLSGAHLPDDYDQMAFFTADAFYRVHTDTGVVDDIFAPTQSVDATDLKVSDNILFFINRYDQKLYAIGLMIT